MSKLDALLHSLEEATLSDKQIAGMRKWWKQWVTKKIHVSSIDSQPAVKHLDDGIKKLQQIAADILFYRGMYSDMRPTALDKKHKSTIYQLDMIRTAIEKAYEALREAKSNIEFIENVTTPGTHEYKLDGGMREMQAGTEAKEKGINKEKVLSNWMQSFFAEGLDKADRAVSRSLFGRLTKLAKPAGGEIDHGEYIREFSVGKLKVVIMDIPPNVVLGGAGSVKVRHPGHFKRYMKEIHKAKALLDRSGLGKLWYGVLKVFPEGLAPKLLAKGFEGSTAGAVYRSGPNDIIVYMDPHISLNEAVIHEIGHRYYFKNLSMQDRLRFRDQFGDIPAVSKYGKTSDVEDFAELFEWYVSRKKLTKEQHDRFRMFMHGKREGIEMDTKLSQLIQETRGYGRGDLAGEFLKGEFDKRKIDQVMQREFAADFMKMKEGKDREEGVSLFYDLSDYEMTEYEPHPSRKPWLEKEHYAQLTDYMVEIIVHEWRGKTQAMFNIYDSHRPGPGHLEADSHDYPTLRQLMKELKKSLEYIEERYWEDYADRAQGPW